MEKPEVNLKQSPVDRMTMLLNMGFSRDEVFWDIMEHCGTSFESNKKKQELADSIAQIDCHNVFATGTIPEKK
jgi:hypothetical protein